MPVVFGLGACLGLEKTESRFKWFTRFTQIYADNLRAAEVCSAEATELPFWERPPVSVANGLCHPTALDPGSFLPTKLLRALARPRQAVMTRFYSLRVVYYWVGCLLHKNYLLHAPQLKNLT